MPADDTDDRDEFTEASEEDLELQDEAANAVRGGAESNVLKTKDGVIRGTIGNTTG